MADQPVTDGKNLIELLDMLEPIPEPEPISMWPATSAWIWLGLIVLAALVWAVWGIHRRWKANAYRRAALAELSLAGDDPARIAAIVRRAALVAYPRHEVARLLADDWLRFLDRTAGGRTQFASDLGGVMARAPYQPQSASPELTQLARSWIKAHKVETPE